MKRWIFLAALLAAAPSWAARDTTPRRTYWDQLMEGQAHRSLYKGSRLMDIGDYSEAVKEFAKAVIAQPDDARAHQMLGVAYYWSGKVDQAETEFRESLRLDPQSGQGHLLLGIALAWKGQAEPAYAEFKKAAELEPERADIQMNLGSMEESMGLTLEALSHYRRAVELQNDHPLYHFQLGTLYRALGRDEEAVDALKRAVKLYPEYEDAMLELGALYERLGKNDDAVDMFRRSVRLKSRDSVARFRLARAFLRSGKNEKAVEVLREVFHLTPTDAGGGLALSLSYGGKPQSSGRPGGAQAQSQPSAPRPETPGPLGLLRRNLERIPLDQEAQLAVDVAFLPKIDPTLKPGDRAGSEAPSSLKRALESAGKMPQGSVMAARRDFKLPAGDAAARTEQIRRVIDDLDKLLASAPAGSETRFGMNLNFTDANPGLNGPGGGEETRKNRAAFQPRDVGNDMGLWVKGTGWTALVEEVLTLKGEAAAHPDEAAWWVIEGIGYATLGDAARAGPAFERALELDADDELAHLGRGVVRVIAGDEEGAIAAYRAALKINPKNRAASEGLKWLERGPVVEEKK